MDDRDGSNYDFAGNTGLSGHANIVDKKIDEVLLIWEHNLRESRVGLFSCPPTISKVICVYDPRNR